MESFRLTNKPPKDYLILQIVSVFTVSSAAAWMIRPIRDRNLLEGKRVVSLHMQGESGYINT